MRFLIISDSFSLDNWLIEDQEPHIMPAVYEWFQFLGSGKQHYFYAIMVHPEVEKVIRFPNGSTIRIFILPVSAHYLRKFLSLFLLYGKATGILKKEKFDLVYGMSVYAALAAIIGRQKRIFSVSRIFGSLVNDLLQNRQYVLLYTRYILQYLEIKLSSDIIISTEDGTQFKESQQQLNPGARVYTLYNGIDKPLRSRLMALIPVTTLSPDHPGRMLSMGRLTGWKRHDLAIRLFYLMKTEYGWNKWKLTILGEGKLKGRLQKIVSDYDLTEEVDFLDPVPHSRIPDILSRHEIFLSLYDVSNLSNSMWEAALAGRFICTRPTGKTSRVFTHFKNSLIAEKPEEMSRYLHQYENADIGHMTLSARNTINSLIPDWKSRFQNEIDIILKEKDNRKQHPQ